MQLAFHPLRSQGGKASAFEKGTYLGKSYLPFKIVGIYHHIVCFAF